MYDVCSFVWYVRFYYPFDGIYYLLFYKRRNFKSARLCFAIRVSVSTCTHTWQRVDGLFTYSPIHWHTLAICTLRFYIYIPTIYVPFVVKFNLILYISPANAFISLVSK